MKYLNFGILFILVMLMGCSSTMNSKPPVEMGDEIFQSEFIEKIMKKVADYQLENPTPHYSKSKDFPMGWVPASFYPGVMALYETIKDEKYLDACVAWGEKNNWDTAPRLAYADDYACGQTYIETFLHKKDSTMIQKIKSVCDTIVTRNEPGREDWWWCDALFMGAPVLIRLYKATGDEQYLDIMDAKFWDTACFLFSKEDGLFYRDERYFYRRTINGKKVFWSRGNGWVMAATVRIIPYFPENTGERRRKKEWYIHLHKTMARSIAKLQSEDGYWRSSLYDPDEYPDPETSGTNFYCFAIAWGINNGHLDKETYLPVVKKAWNAMVKSVHPNGKIGWVQKIGRNPDTVTYEDTHAYGAGGFLLAGSEVIKLAPMIFEN